MKKVDTLTVRGIIYASIALIGLSYEILFAPSIRPLPVIAYSLVILIGVLCILKKI